MLRYPCCHFVAWIAVIALSGIELKADEPAEPCFRNLPIGWEVARSLVVPADRLSEIEKNLGAAVSRISNTWLNVQGQTIQVNVVQVKTEQDAEKLHAVISQMKGNPAYCVLKGTEVIEYTGRGVSVALARTVSHELGFVKKPSRIRYRVVAKLATVEQADYMACNPLFNLFLQTQENPANAEFAGQIARSASRFEFGDRLALRACAQGEDRPVFRFDPAPTSWDYSQQTQRITYSFPPLPRTHNVPYVTATLEITVDATAMSPSTRQADESLVAATRFWPADDPEIVQLAAQVTAGCETRQAKIDAMLKWVGPSGNIPSGGPTGSRWGVQKVLQQKHGRCWDRADCFVTLCRAADIPCRQVAGWIYGMAGHVWAEVLIEGKGWQQVDPSGGGVVGCGIYHIPYFVTEDGEMPILYVAMPEIEILGSN